MTICICVFFQEDEVFYQEEGVSTPTIFKAIDCTIDIVYKSVINEGTEYMLEGVVSSVYG